MLPRIQWRSIKPPIGARINPMHSINQGIFAWWLMNEGGGATTRDVVSGRELVLTNMDTASVWQDGLFGCQIDHDGTDDHLAHAYTGLTFPISVLLRFRPDATGSYFSLFSYNTTSNSGGWRIGHNPLGPINFVLGGVAEYTFPSAGSLTANSDFSLVLTISENSGVAVVYLKHPTGNVLSHSQSIGTMGGTPDSFFTARRGDASDIYNGKISEITVWNRVLSDSEARTVIDLPYGQPNNPRIIIGPMRTGAFGASGGAGPTGSPWYYYAQQ